MPSTATDTASPGSKPEPVATEPAPTETTPPGILPPEQSRLRAALFGKAKIPLVREYIIRRAAGNLDGVVAELGKITDVPVQLDVLGGIRASLAGQRKTAAP